jgi:hypothetical protein
VLLVHAVSPVKTPFDSAWSIPTVLSLLHERDFDLDEYRPTPISHGVVEIQGHLYTEYPIGGPLLALAPVLVFDGAIRLSRPAAALHPSAAAAVDRWVRHADATGLIDPGFFDTTEMLVASLVVALATVLAFATARRRATRAAAVACALIFAFCTPAWSTASRALWQHGPSMLAIFGALYLLERGRDDPRAVQLASIPLAFAYVCRPTNAIPAALFTAAVALQYRRFLLRYCLWGLLVAVPFLAFNRAVYGAWLGPYYRPSMLAAPADMAGPLAAVWLSPSRGLLVFSPVLGFSLYGAALLLRRRELGWIGAAALASALLHGIVAARFWCWWGGHSYGPRLLSDAVPFLCYLLVPVVSLAVAQWGQRRRRGLLAALTLASALSFAIHLRGATSWQPHAWNSSPVDVNEAPGRAWDWTDPQFLR